MLLYQKIFKNNKIFGKLILLMKVIIIKGSQRKKMENIFKDLNYLVECKRLINERTDFLEWKRFEILNRIKIIGQDFSIKEKGAFEHRVILMEINV